jgi:hypothetical protein
VLTHEGRFIGACPGGMLPLRAYGVALASMLAGASVVHNVFQPDLTIPGYEPEDLARQQQQGDPKKK